ncbi:aspartate 1-decarboxylase autocleavage activator PanM, partial [Proteus mirabilis]|uniref:aspartate 1-decarboxylase autocleavage activator PanM n=1 Tax=Proteus mirabilis TaxID=584 RepID=UPI002578C242
QMALTAPITTEHALFVARFNGRLLEACRIKYQAKTALISDFMVREVTRRRCVGHYLLTQCLEKNPTITHWQALLK